MSEWIISSSVLIVLVIALRHVLRGKISLRLQYALWLVVLVRLLMPVSIADSSFSIASLLQKNQTHQISDIFLWYGSESNPGGEGEYLPNRGEIGEQGNQQIGGEKPGNVTTPINPDASVTDKPPVSDEPVKYPTIGGISIAPSTDKLENSGKALISLGEILMIIWCAGMAVTAVMLLVSNLHFNSKLQKTRWLYEKKTDSLPVYESDAVETPCLFGLIRPAVYVTKEAVKDPNVMHHVLAHETTHYAHRDHIWAVLRCLCLVLHWYNPLVWWAADLSRRDAELACDEGTIERIGEAVRVEYGRTLIGLTCQGRGYLLSTATTMTGSVKGIKERIMLIANRPKMARYTVMLLIVLVMVMIGCTYCGVKETDVGAGGKEESTESAEHVSESVDESTTEAVETEVSTEMPTEETTEAVSEEVTSEALGTKELVVGGEKYTGVIGVYETDLDHDGADEILIAQYEENAGNPMAWVKLIKNDSVVWEEELPMANPASGNAYFLYTQDGLDYLVQYHTFQTNYAEASYIKFYFEEGFVKEIVDTNGVKVFSTPQYYYPGDFPVSSDSVKAYVAGVNTVLENSFLICGRLNGEFAFSTEESKITYAESADRLMEVAFVKGPDYSGCKNLDEKLTILNQYLLNQWFVDGKVPEMPEEFKTHMEQLLVAARNRMNWMPELAGADRSEWFADYNGEKLQMIKAEKDGGSALAAFRGTVYYRADQGETVETVAKRMAEAIAESMMLPAEGRGFTITKYLITEQNLLSWDDLVASYTDLCWYSYLREHREVGSDLLDEAAKWVEQRSFEGEIPLQDEMWYFVPKGYYRYEGYDLVTFETKAQYAGEIVDEMIPLSYDGMDVYFLLVKQGDVYRLQKVSCWNE